MRVLRSLVVVFMFLLVISFRYPQHIERVYARLESRQVQKGKSITIKSEICYDQNGDIISHFISPAEYLIISNKVGEIKLYDPTKNTIMIRQNSIFSSQTSQLYYFLNGKTDDMGLNELGFVPTKTYPESNVIVTEWKRKTADLKSSVQKVKLVSQQQHPIYMDYRNKDNRIIRKIYYSAYRKLNQFDFPAISTEIIYNDKSDSTVTRTVYSDFAINEQAVSPYFGFKIPASAKKINE